jgi:hypothetical protein
MERDAGDILDRWSIAKLKAERIGTEDNLKEDRAFTEELLQLQNKYPEFDWCLFTKMMLDINDFIWQLEAGLKSGKETLKNPYYILDDINKDALAKIGTTTILIRNFNHLRINFKNIINKLTHTGFQDQKKDHLSADNLNPPKR